MFYNIALRIYQTNPARGYFRIVEQAVWRLGTWSEKDGMPTLTLYASDTAGIVRFVSDKGESITVVVGVHQYQRWCDVVTDRPSATAVEVLGEYYNGGFRSYTKEQRLAEYGVTSAAGTTFSVVYTVAEGNNLEANVIFK